jgi:hypothetical protein
MSIAEGIYLLCAATSLLTPGLLIEPTCNAARRCCCGVDWVLGLALNNVLVFADLGAVQDHRSVDSSHPRRGHRHARAAGRADLGGGRLTGEQIPAIQAVSGTAAFSIALFFFRFWRRSRDPLFGYFGAAFCLVATSSGLLAFFAPVGEARPYVYAVRLLASC